MKRELKLRYQRNAYYFHNNHEVAYKALLELEDTHNQDAYKKIAEEHNLKLEGVKLVHFFIRKLKSIGVPVNPPQPVIKVQKRRGERNRMDLESFKRNHAECYNRLREIMEKGQPMDKSTRRQLGKKYGLKPDTVNTKFCQMKRLAKKDEERQEDDGSQMEEDEEQEEQMDDGEFEDPDPNEPSTSGPPRRTRRSSRRRSREGNDAIEYFRKPATSSSRKHTKRQEEGDDCLDLDPRTRTEVGNSERRSRRAKKISVPRAISTKRHHSSVSPDAPEAKRRQTEPRGLREPARSPSPPPEHRNPRGDRESVLVSRQMEESNVTEPSRSLNQIYNNVQQSLEIIDNSLVQMKDNYVSDIGRSLRGHLEEMKRLLQLGTRTSSEEKGYCKSYEETGSQTDPETRSISDQVNSSQAQPDSKAPETTDHTISPVTSEPEEAVEPELVVQMTEVVESERPYPEVLAVESTEMQEIIENVLQEETVEQLRQQDETPEDRPDSADSVTIPLESEPKSIVQTRRSVALEEQDQQEDEAVVSANLASVQTAEASVGEQMDLGTGESMPHVFDELAIQSVDQQPEDDSTQNVLPESSVQTKGTVVLEEQPLERADSETQSTMNKEIRVGTVEQQQQDERTRPLLETRLIEDHTRSQVILEPEEAVEPQSMVHVAKVPEETTENAPRSQSTDSPACHDSIYKDIEDALGILHNSLRQLRDADVIEIGRSLQVDLKEMKRLLQSSTVPGTSSWKRQYLEHSENINDINICLTALGSFLSELTVEDRDGMSDELKLDLSKVQSFLYNWNGNGAKAIKEEQMDVEEGVQIKTEYPDEPMEQEQQDGTPQDRREAADSVRIPLRQVPASSPARQVKQEPEEESLADSNY